MYFINVQIKILTSKAFDQREIDYEIKYFLKKQKMTLHSRSKIYLICNIL